MPDVILHTTVQVRDAHPAYVGAKSGDADQALALAIELISDSGMAQIAALLDGRQPLLLPVVADETMGFNAIPDAMAQVMGRELNCEVVTAEIVQVNKVGHTRARAFQRFVTPALFDGAVVSGADYLLIDDHVGLGGTLANLRGFVEARGARVLGISTLTESRHARRISLRAASLLMLQERYGEALDQLWIDQFGYGIDCLTDVEAGILCRQPTVAAIENFLAQAAIEARSRGLQPALD
ncbi:phosphoribosyltransferase [Rhizorhabdus argentea]|uniref:phosphoribosyltransferase n=1 Tax=Rhizorhabdus argentea TaxID=1387174 RepID=UPI0030EE4FB0